MISCYFGKPGCGKSTMATKIIVDALRKRKYDRIYTNLPIANTYRLDFNKLGIEDYSNCLIVIDEITLLSDSRDYKSFGQNLKEFFCLHRHYNAEIVYLTQFYNRVDKTIRVLTDRVYYMIKIAGLSLAFKIPFRLTFPEETGEILLGYCRPNILGYLTPKICNRHKYYPYFDSFSKPLDLKPNTADMWDSAFDTDYTALSTKNMTKDRLQ